ncbi:c-type cytochrome [Leptospira ilyithenensis]|uniref:Cytochrome c n=1 Tax=Leptospira ilyithenensis TaxID=2484901 RepID=A0A4R9LLH9_9LEPT|nr:cytochrome c [Leptospira ilyithenensis]TGN08422.1 cytochrome c [Leptospira ilyithenensis]
MIETQKEKRFRFLFVFFLLSASSILQNCSLAEDAELKKGREIFEKYCVLCHGSEGLGNGKLANGKNVRPANLQISRLTDEQKYQIITKGGQAVGRSSFMPPWGLEFSQSDLKSLVLYINTLKKQ